MRTGRHSLAFWKQREHQPPSDISTPRTKPIKNVQAAFDVDGILGMPWQEDLTQAIEWPVRETRTSAIDLGEACQEIDSPPKMVGRPGTDLECPQEACVHLVGEDSRRFFINEDVLQLWRLTLKTIIDTVENLSRCGFGDLRQDIVE